MCRLHLLSKQIPFNRDAVKTAQQRLCRGLRPFRSHDHVLGHRGLCTDEEWS